jgi:hypothetical protein
MNEIKPKVVKATLDFNSWIRYYIYLWNGSIKLTEAEIDLLEMFLSKYFELKQSISLDSELYELLFSTKKRKEIKEKLNISEQVFNNRFTALKKKSIILENNGVYRLNPMIIPLKEVTFKFEVI